MKTTRRELLRTAAGSVLVSHLAMSAAHGHQEKIHIEAGKLAELMKITCGGQWRVSVDQDLEFILVQKVLT